MLSHSLRFIACVLAGCLSSMGQEASSGVSVPITISAEARDTGGSPQSEYGGKSAGFRAVLYPTVKFGAHWFAYSALEAHSSEYFPYQIGIDRDQEVRFNVMQAFVAYTQTVSNVSVLVKAGQLSSAFGLFPLEYDDATMPLVNAPPVYVANLPFRGDQVPCGVNDVLRQTYGSEIDSNCGGSEADSYGLLPVTLYGLPSVEAEISVARVDARLQITNSSPANPQGFTSSSQFPQWTAGAGYTFPGGLHVGMSGFRGPYLDKSLGSWLPVGTTNRSFPASGVGLDVQWSRDAWSMQGEWQSFHFELPGFILSPSENAAYAQVKRIVSPRLFLATRVTAQSFGRIKDSSGVSSNYSAGPQQVYELTAGYRLNRQQLLKAGAGWTDRNAWAANGWFWPRGESYSLELQLVTSLTALSKAFR